MNRRIVKGGLVQVRGRQRGGTLLRKKKYVYEEERFMVLCIHDNKIPLLEWYEEDRDRWNHTPLKVLDLLGCHSVSATIGQPRCFTISFTDDDRPPIELSASSEEQCSDWISHLTDALQKLNCLEGNAVENGEERYGEFLPAASPDVIAEAVQEHLRQTPRTSPRSRSPSIPIKIQRSVLDREITLPNPCPSLPFAASLDISPAPQLNASPRSLPNHHYSSQCTAVSYGAMWMPEIASSSGIRISHELSGKEQESFGGDPPLTPPPLPPRRTAVKHHDSPSPSNVNTSTHEAQAHNERIRTMSNRMPIAQYDILPTSDGDEQERTPVDSSTIPNPSQKECPKGVESDEDEQKARKENPYLRDASCSQVPSATGNNQLVASRSVHYDYLPETMETTMLPKFETLPRPRDVSLLKSLCIEHLAFVEMGNRIWIAGWNPRMDCHLRGVVHFGDEVLRIGGTAPRSMHEFVALLHSQALPGAPVRLKIAVTPFGVTRTLKIPTSYGNEGGKLDAQKVFGMQIRKNQVVSVEARSAAAEAGIPTHLPPYLYSATGEESPATITELNSVPLNPFARSNEQFLHRIQSMPPDSTLSIIFHPSDFVTSLKDQLKSIKGYKTFLHQPTLDSDH